MEESKKHKFFKTKLGLSGFSIGTAVYMLFFILPVIWMIIVSFKPNSEVIVFPPKIFSNPILDNYITVFNNPSILRGIINSTLIATSVTTLTIVCATTSAYAFTRFRSRSNKRLSTIVLITRMIPGIVLGLPLYIIGSRINVLDTYFIMIIAITTIALPFQIWMLMGFFQQIPRSLDEAALVDGCNLYQAFHRVILPSATPGIAATAILTFLFSWNDLFFAVVLTRRQVKTAPLAILDFMGYETFNWAAIMAGGVVLMLPTMLLGFTLQKYMVKGLTTSAIKG